MAKTNDERNEESPLYTQFRRIIMIKKKTENISIAIVGGTFNEKGGRPSYITSRIASGIQSALLNRHNSDGHVKYNVEKLFFWNGGATYKLAGITGVLWETKPDILIWIPDIPNDTNAMTRDRLKKELPHTFLVTSKRNDSEKYSVAEITAKMLGMKANLCMEIHRTECKNKPNKHYYNVRLLDPLCNERGIQNIDAADFARYAGNYLMNSIHQLRDITRIGCTKDVITDTQRASWTFMDIIHNSAQAFSKLVPKLSKAKAKRFMGNASFRCSSGFPSYRADDQTIMVSRRNVDKLKMEREDFVPCRLSPRGDKVIYDDENKPSVDTPIQLKLYEYYKNVNFILHGHVTIKDAPETKRCYPAGPWKNSMRSSRSIPTREPAMLPSI